MITMTKSRFLRAACSAASAVALASCDGGSLSPAQARNASVVEAAGGALKGATLERWLLELTQQPTASTANVLVSSWINTALAIDAIRRNVPIDDSATIDAVIRPDAERGASMEYFAQRNARRPPVSDAEADSLADIDR